MGCWVRRRRVIAAVHGLLEERDGNVKRATQGAPGPPAEGAPEAAPSPGGEGWRPVHDVGDGDGSEQEAQATQSPAQRRIVSRLRKLLRSGQFSQKASRRASQIQENDILSKPLPGASVESDLVVSQN